MSRQTTELSSSYYKLHTNTTTPTSTITIFLISVYRMASLLGAWHLFLKKVTVFTK